MSVSHANATAGLDMSNPSDQYFRNKLLQEQLSDLNHLESNARLSLMRSHHKAFVEIADEVLNKLQMITLEKKTNRSVTAMGYPHSPSANSSVAFRSELARRQDAAHQHDALFRSFDSTIGQYMADGSFAILTTSPKKFFETDMEEQPVVMTRNSLKNASFPISTQPTHTQLFSSAVKYIDPSQIVEVDVSGTLRRKDTKLKALSRTFEEEERKAEIFRLSELKRTEASQRRKQSESDMKLARTQRATLNTHVSYIQLQKTKAEVQAREHMRDREKAIETRNETLELKRRAQDEARRRIGILASDTIKEAQHSFNDASAAVKLANLKLATTQKAIRDTKNGKTDKLVSRKLKAENYYETLMSSHNNKEAELLERRQHISYGERDAQTNLRPEESSVGKFGIVKDLPVDVATNRPFFTPRSNPGMRNLGPTTPRTSNKAEAKASSPINPLTYQRLCGGRGALTTSAVYDEAYGLGKRMTDLDSYYLLRGPQDVSWKR